MRFATKNPDELTDTEKTTVEALVLVDARITRVFCFPPDNGIQEWGFQVKTPAGKLLDVLVTGGGSISIHSVSEYLALFGKR